MKIFAFSTVKAQTALVAPLVLLMSAWVAAPALAVTSSPSPSVSFQAVVDNQSAAPPDTDGAVGPRHVVTAVNGQIEIQDRGGNILSQQVSLSSFWAGVAGTGGAFQPRTRYDAGGSRWLMAAQSAPGTANSAVLLGATQSDDPTTPWKLFKIKADSSGTAWANAPTLGFNKDWVVVCFNMYAVSDNSFVRSDIYVFRKSDLYAGTTPRYRLFSDGTAGFAAAVTYDNSLSTMYLLQRWNPNSLGSGSLRLSTITGPVGSEVLTTDVAFPQSASPWDSTGPTAPQRDSNIRISTGDDRVQSVVYRGGSLWCAQTVFLPGGGAYRAAVQWWQIDTSGTVQQFGRIDDSSGSTFYAYPSIAVNQENDALLGFSTFSYNQNPSAAYVYRAGTDPVNTMQGVVTLKGGDAPYSKVDVSGRARWGDYSASQVDPVNDQDLWTLQEYATTPTTVADRWATWWGKLVITIPFKVTWTVKDISTGPDGKTRVLWNNVDGRALAWVIGTDGSIEVSDIFGPFTGWSARSLSTGADNKMRLLWGNTDGTAALWRIGQGSQASGGGAIESNVTYGPYTGWNAVNVAMGGDNKTRLLWANTDGTAAVWVIGPDGLEVNNSYGPYSGWNAAEIALAGDNLTRVLWNNTDGRAALWLLNPGDQSVGGGTLQTNYTYGPFPGWQAQSIGAGADGKTRVEWVTGPSQAALWVIGSGGNLEVNNNYGPFTSWSPGNMVTAGDNKMRVVWNNVDGRAALWLVSFGSTPYGGIGLDSNLYYGPLPKVPLATAYYGPY